MPKARASAPVPSPALWPRATDPLLDAARRAEQSRQRGVRRDLDAYAAKAKARGDEPAARLALWLRDGARGDDGDASLTLWCRD